MPPLVMLSNPQDIRSIAAAPPDDLHAGGGGALLAPVFGERAFMLLEKGEHASVREAITPMFHNRMVQGHADAIAEVVDREVSSWPAEDAVSLSPYLDRLTLKAMLRIAIVDREPMYEELCRRMLEMLAVMASPLLQAPRLRHLPGWRGMWRRFIADHEAVDELVYGLIQRRRERGAPGFLGNDSSGNDGLGNNSHGNDGTGNDFPSDKDRQGDLLDLLIAARNPDGSPLLDRQVRDNLVSTIVAGQETTAATLGWTLQTAGARSSGSGSPDRRARRGRGGWLHERGDPGGAAAPAHVPVPATAGRHAADRDRWLELPAAGTVARVHVSVASRSGALCRSTQIPAGAFSAGTATAGDVVAVGAGTQALSRPADRADRDPGGAETGAVDVARLAGFPTHRRSTMANGAAHAQPPVEADSVRPSLPAPRSHSSETRFYLDVPSSL